MYVRLLLVGQRPNSLPLGLNHAYRNLAQEVDEEDRRKLASICMRRVGVDGWMKLDEIRNNIVIRD